MSGTGAPSTAVKDAIDAQSGRFEYFKQCLTLGLAGIGGAAALLTDPAKVPGDAFSKWVVALAGCSLLTTVMAAAFGISSYANLLKATSNETRPNHHLGKYNSDFYALDIIKHARTATVALGLASAFLALFALKQLAFSSAPSVENAVDNAAKFVGEQTKQPPEKVSLRRLEVDTNDYSVVYSVPGYLGDVVVRISKKDGNVTGATMAKDQNSGPGAIPALKP